jgi:hypothetical protein
MKKHEREYLDALQAFSLPARDRWTVTWLDGDQFHFEYRGSTGYELYRYWDGTPAVDFTYRMAEQALDVELRSNVEYLERYDYVSRKINEAVDVRGSVLAILVRGALENQGKVSNRRRDQHQHHVTEAAFELIERYATEALARDPDELGHDERDGELDN